jgi:cystathionine beta-lyase
MDGDEAWLKQRTHDHEAIRDEFVGRLRAIPGVSVASPAGSSYVFPDASRSPWTLRHGSNDDFELTKELKRNGVLVSPGYQFGLDGRGHIRINFSQVPERLSRAADAIEKVLSQR